MLCASNPSAQSCDECLNRTSSAILGRKVRVGWYLFVWNSVSGVYSWMRFAGPGSLEYNERLKEVEQKALQEQRRQHYIRSILRRGAHHVLETKGLAGRKDDEKNESKWFAAFCSCTHHDVAVNDSLPLQSAFCRRRSRCCERRQTRSCSR